MAQTGHLYKFDSGNTHATASAQAAPVSLGPVSMRSSDLNHQLANEMGGNADDAKLGVGKAVWKEGGCSSRGTVGIPQFKIDLAALKNKNT